MPAVIVWATSCARIRSVPTPATRRLVSPARRHRSQGLRQTAPARRQSSRPVRTCFASAIRETVGDVPVFGSTGRSDRPPDAQPVSVSCEGRRRKSSIVVSNIRASELGFGGSGACTCAKAGEGRIRQNAVAAQAIDARKLLNGVSRRVPIVYTLPGVSRFTATYCSTTIRSGASASP